jgi:hypothetical protein
MLPRVLSTVLLVAVSSAAVLSQGKASSPEVEAVEIKYADLADAYYVTSTIDSGLFKTYQGKDRAAWNELYQAKRKEVTAELAKLPSEKLSKADARVVSFIQKALGAMGDSSESLKPQGSCGEARRKEIEASKLRDAIYSCFDEVGNNIQFEGKHLTRLSALDLLSTLDEESRRKALFLAFQPLWAAINNQNEPQSSYRRLLRSAAVRAVKEGYRFETAARALGVKPMEVERWLEQVLDAWRRVSGDQMSEPWNFYYVNGEANRMLSDFIPCDSLLSITQHYYRDLGADLKQRGVLYDLDPRPRKAPLAYMDFVTLGRQMNGPWRPSVVRISANYSSGGLSELNEFIHENGHAVHGLALRTRPAYMDLGDPLLAEAFADVTSWDVYDPKWQEKYLGRAVPVSVSLRTKYSSVVLDCAWALFEIRLLQNPDADPNVVWTEITSRYLRIVPHPDLSWWALRVQLADPGYMVNYGLGAVLTADLRQHTVESIGPFHTGNSRWYSWLSANLLRFGNERDAFDLLKAFIGRPVSSEALIHDIARAKP